MLINAWLYEMPDKSLRSHDVDCAPETCQPSGFISAENMALILPLGTIVVYRIDPWLEPREATRRMPGCLGKKPMTEGPKPLARCLCR